MTFREFDRKFTAFVKWAVEQVVWLGREVLDVLISVAIRVLLRRAIGEAFAPPAAMSSECSCQPTHDLQCWPTELGYEICRRRVHASVAA